MVISIPQNSKVKISVNWTDDGLDPAYNVIAAVFGQNRIKTIKIFESTPFYPGGFVLAATSTPNVAQTDIIPIAVPMDKGTYDLWLGLYKYVNQTRGIPTTIMAAGGESRITGLGQVFMDCGTYLELQSEKWYDNVVTILDPLPPDLYTVAVKVVLSGHNTPIAGVSVRVVAQNPQPDGSSNIYDNTMITGSDGRASFTLPYGQYNFITSKSGNVQYPQSPLEHMVATSQEVVLQMAVNNSDRCPIGYTWNEEFNTCTYPLQCTASYAYSNGMVVLTLASTVNQYRSWAGQILIWYNGPYGYNYYYVSLVPKIDLAPYETKSVNIPLGWTPPSGSYPFAVEIRNWDNSAWHDFIKRTLTI